MQQYLMIIPCLDIKNQRRLLCFREKSNTSNTNNTYFEQFLGSIFMTVAIAWERYVAVHYPMDYNQAVNDANAIRNRLQKYVGPVTLLALAFNVVKFFEAKVCM